MNQSDPVAMSQAIWRGFTGHCPNCGQGHLFGRFLKVIDQCEVCEEPLHHQRADDFPAYLVMFFVGHIVVSLALSVEIAYTPPYWLHLVLWLPLTLVLALGLLQPTKGAVIGLQWQIGLHGFQASKDIREKKSKNAAVPVMEMTALEPAADER